MRICCVEDCTKHADRTGYCDIHFGTRKTRICKVDGCGLPHRSNGYCFKHYCRVRNNGDLDLRIRAFGTGSIDKRTGYICVGIDKVRKLEHIRVAEKALGKPLPPGAQVHHVDGNTSNNSPTNLVICPDQDYHKLLHKRMRALEACGNVDYLKCKYCGGYDDPNNMKLSRTKDVKNTQWHLECYNKHMRNYRLKRKKEGRPLRRPKGF